MTRQHLPAGSAARTRRLNALRPARGLKVTRLPAWPVMAPFSLFIVWWAVGFGDIAWLLAAGCAVIFWPGQRGMSSPRIGILWALFLLWVLVSLVMVDTSGRLIGAVYRFAFFLAAGILSLHVYNARHSLPLRRILVAMTAFLACMTIGGYLAMAFPEYVLHTPLSYILPKNLLSNDLVRDIALRRMTQWNPNSWIVQEPRPSAPFLYTNTWGNVYSLVLPLSLLHLRVEWVRPSRWRWVVAAVIAASVIPAVNTMNRGMYIGLGVVAVWVGFQMLRVGRWKETLAGVAVVASAGLVWWFSSAGAELSYRLATTQSTSDRLALYAGTVEELAKSPLIGYGAPRPATEYWLPALGTQGQLWTVLFSYGIGGALLFVAFFVIAFAYALNRMDLLGAVLGGIILATLVESFYYGMMTGLMVSLLAVALLFRGDRIEACAANIADPRRRFRQ